MPESPLPLLSVDGSAALVQYDLGTQVEAVNTPKPHIHPLRTPQGVVITDFAPEDHLWHMGLQFGIPWVGEDNLWGGGSYLGPERGYEVIPNQGVIRHDGFQGVENGEDAASLTEDLSWVTSRGTTALGERRRIDATLHHGAAGSLLRVDHTSELTNPAAQAVELGTPAQKGRADGGYGGLFLRLALDFEMVEAWSDQGPAQESGHRGRVFIVHGQVGGRPVTIGLADLTASDVAASRWLYRFEPFPAIGWAGMYDDGIELGAGDRVTFAHRLVVGDGLRDSDEISSLLLAS